MTSQSVFSFLSLSRCVQNLRRIKFCKDHTSFLSPVASQPLKSLESRPPCNFVSLIDLEAFFSEDMVLLVNSVKSPVSEILPSPEVSAVGKKLPWLRFPSVFKLSLTLF